ncbi:MAG: type II toxin-antitoxin system HicB family antitoxin [Desulfamplus sp.]|nr:type II toxin-antitoxin system HicB family antitoxin [Desulfamplus sp.]
MENGDIGGQTFIIGIQIIENQLSSHNASGAAKNTGIGEDHDPDTLIGSAEKAAKLLGWQAHFPIIIEQDADDMFIVTCPVFKGCHSYGYTIDEAIKNITEAIGSCLIEMSVPFLHYSPPLLSRRGGRGVRLIYKICLSPFFPFVSTE